MSLDAEIEIPVLIVGGSMVGMTTALLLGYHGVPSLVVEHHRGTAIHPRAASVTQRTMEIFRSVGIEQIVRTKSEAQFVQDAGVVGVETLAGGATAHYIANFNDGIRDLSPTVRVFLSQNALEPTLKEGAERYGARILFSTECISLEQDANGVTALIRHRDTGETQKGARAIPDCSGWGAQPHPRESGHPHARAWRHVEERHDLFPRKPARFLEGKLGAVVYANHPQLRGFFRFEKPFESAFLVVNTLGDATRPNVDVSKDFTTESALQMVRLAIGVPGNPGHDRERDALESDGRHSGALSRRSYFHRWRCRTRHAADRWLGR